jgi:hypothetical protein
MFAARSVAVAVQDLTLVPASLDPHTIKAAQRSWLTQLVPGTGRVHEVGLREALRRRRVTPERRAAIGEAILQIEELVDRGEDATAAIAALNHNTGHSFGLDDFRYHCAAPGAKGCGVRRPSISETRAV